MRRSSARAQRPITATATTSALRLDGSAGAVVLPAQFAISTSNPNGAIINEAGGNEIGSGITLTSGAGSTRITSNAGTLTIQGNVAPNVTGRSLELRGAGKGVINGGVADGSVANTLGTVTKNDAGTWTLNGSNALLLAFALRPQHDGAERARVEEGEHFHGAASAPLVSHSRLKRASVRPAPAKPGFVPRP